MSSAERELRTRLSGSLWQALKERALADGESTDHIVRAALASFLNVDHATIFQVSTAGALAEGLYRGEVTVGDLRTHGDFGIGTLDGLDGEMVVLDSRFYQARSDGAVVELGSGCKVPYAVVTRFAESPAHDFDATPDLNSLQTKLDGLRDSQNIFYAIRVDGHFQSVHVRSVAPTAEGVPLVEAASHQREFQFENIQGTLVGFWSPGFLGSLLIPGYHLHFISDDRHSGGHLLGCSGTGLVARIQKENDIRVSLPESAAFLRADLTRDPSADLAKAEH